jgi:hypothetical protein
MVRLVHRMSNKICPSSILLAATIIISIFSIAIIFEKADAASWKYGATLAGRNEVPPLTNTSATGLADFRMSDNDTTIRYRVNLTGITNVTGGHIHVGKIGQNGDIAADLFQIGFTKHKKTNSGMIIRGNITELTLKGSMKGKTVSDLVALIDTGEAYVNINTRTHPQGEIRGQMEVLNQSKTNTTGVGISTLTH